VGGVLIGVYLRRGLLTGLVAGLLAGLFGFIFGEPALERAVELESHAQGDEHSKADETFSRDEQKAGLFLATALYGAAMGGAFGLVSAFMEGRAASRSRWARSLTLAAAIFAGAVLLPFLKYPPNPPGVGADPATLTARTTAYLAMVVLSLLTVLFAWRLSRELEGLAAPTRHLLVGAVLLFFWVLLLILLPSFGGVGEAPADLVWSFRLSALGTQAVLWAGIGCIFGLLNERAEARDASNAVVAEGEPQ
jgi:predicted cobalt transporter CbtA